MSHSNISSGIFSFAIGCILLMCLSCNSKIEELDLDSPPKLKSGFLAKRFQFPVGKGDTSAYYNAQGFGGKHNHLGDDWNAVTGGNTDLGHPIYLCANGYVKEAKDFKGGWGNVIRVVHFLENDTVESLYAHCDKILVKKGSWIEKGTQIGTIGTAHGQYLAHLHFEIREDLSLGLGGGYSKNNKGYLNPTIFIKNHLD